MLAALGVAAHEAVTALLAAQSGTSSTASGGTAGLPTLPKLAVAVADYEPFTYMRDIKANLIGPQRARPEGAAQVALGCLTALRPRA